MYGLGLNYSYQYHLIVIILIVTKLFHTETANKKLKSLKNMKNKIKKVLDYNVLDISSNTETPSKQKNT